MSRLAKTAAIGVVLTLTQNVGTRAVAFLAQLVLARLLMPDQFGLIGLVLSLNALVQPLMDFGIEDILMSRRKSLGLWLGPAYGLSISLGLLSALLLGLAGPVAAYIYKVPELTGLLANMALGAFLYGFSIVPDAKLRSDMRFDITSSYALAEIVGVQGATLVLAWAGCGAYAFVLPAPLAAATRAAVFYHLAPVDLRGGFRVSRWRCLLGRGMLVFAQRLLQTLREQGDFILLGFVASPATVGFYYLGYRLAAQPVYMLVRSLSAVLFPMLTNVRDDPRRQAAVAVRAARMLGLLVTPASFLLAAVAEPFILLLFGPRWAPAVPYVQILSIGLAFDVLPGVTYALATARGLFRLQLALGAGATALFIASILAGFAIAGAVGVAGGVAFYFMAVSIIYPAVVFRPLPDRFSVLTRLFIEPAALAGIAIGAGAAAAAALPAEWLIGRIALTSLTGGLLYVALAALFLRGFLWEIAAQFFGDAIPKRFTQRHPA